MSLAEQVELRKAYGVWLMNRELLVAARDEFQCWLSLVEPTEDPALLIQPLNALFAVYHKRLEYDKALEYVRRALTLCDDPRVLPEERLKVCLNLTLVYMDLGQLDQAMEYARQATGLSVGRENVFGGSYFLFLTRLHWLRQEWGLAFEAADKLFALSQEPRWAVMRYAALVNRGAVYLELGDFDRAERDLIHAIEDGERSVVAKRAYPYTELGRLYFLRGEYEAALKVGRDALNALLANIGGLDKEEVARVSRLFGSIFFLCGQRNLALKYLNRAAAYFSQLGLREEWQRSTQSIGQVLVAPARPTRGQLKEEVHHLDFLTAVLDMTDDLESIDPYLRGHSERVASLAVILGEDLGFSREELVTLSHAARLADVGMIAVDAELLQREGPLTDAELTRVAMHASIGEEMIRPYGFSSTGLQGIRHHHERYDGCGFPDGLKGEAIPMIARVIAVADVYDALTSDRTFRPAMAHNQAVAEVAAMSGHKLDPALVQRFLSLFRRA